MHIDSLLRKTLGLKGHRVEKVYEDESEIIALDRPQEALQARLLVLRQKDGRI